MLILFTPVILMCFSALTVLLGPLASVRGRHSLYAGLEARRSPAATLLDGSPLANSWIAASSVFEVDSYAAGNFTATVLSKPVSVFHCPAPSVPPPATHTTTAVVVAGTFALPDPSVTVKNDRRDRAEHNVPLLAAILAASALFIAGTLLSGRMQVLGLERRKAALQTRIDDYMRDTLRRAADISATQARYTSERASLIQLEYLVVTLVADLETAKTSVVQTEASAELADERSIGLHKLFDALLQREHVTEESYLQEVAWFDERCSILNSQRADPPKQQPAAEQASAEINTLEENLEGCKAKLRLSEVREQERLGAINNLKQDIEQNCTDGGALLQEKTTLELACLAIQDRAVALRVGHEQKIDEFGMKLDDTELAIAGANERADATAEHSNTLQTELSEAQEAASHLRTYHTNTLKAAHERIDGLNAAIGATDVELDEVLQINMSNKAELPALRDEADAFEAVAAKMEAENDAAESQLTQDDAEDDLWRGVLTAERDDLLDEQTNAHKEFQGRSKDIEDTQLSTAGAVSAITASQGAAEQRYLEQATMLGHQISSNSTTTDALATRYKTLKASLAAREAQYSARLDEFTQAEEQCAQDIEESMFLTREAAFDAQQYESLGIEATRKQREAQGNAARAVERADRAQAQMVATEKEMRISRYAFSTQVKDVEAQCASLARTTEDLKTEDGALGDANSQLTAEIDRQTAGFERKAGTLRSRLIDAEAGLHIFDTMQDDIQQRMDAHLNAMQVRREELQGIIQDHGCMIDTADEAIAETVREREEEEDALSAAEGQAEALTLLLFSPRSHGAGTPALSFASSSATSSPTSPAEVLGTPQDYEVIFDASLGELDVEAGILVESATVKALVPGNVGLGILL